MNIKKIIKILILIIILILTFCLIMKNFFPAEWSFITPHKQGDFVRVGNMHHPMYGHDMILLDDGRVFVYDAGNVEVYNPKTRRFKNISKNGNKLSYKPAVLKLQDGRVMMIGGANGNTTHPYTYFFNPKTNKITKGPNMITGRERFSAILLNDGRVFVSGGEYYDDEKRKRNIKYESRLKSTEFYNPKTNKFEYGPELPEILSSITMIASGNNIYLIGGVAHEQSPDGASLVSTKIWKFNPHTRNISHVSDLNKPRLNPYCFKLDNDILIFNGQGATWLPTKSIELFDTKCNKNILLQENVLVHNKSNPVLLPDGRLLFVGGSSGIGISYREHNDAFIYDYKNKNLKILKSKLQINMSYSKGITLKDGNILFIGNRNYGIFKNLAFLYIVDGKFDKQKNKNSP